MSKTLKEVYDSKFFHGTKTEVEAYELCKEELENRGNKQDVCIRFLEEKDGKLRDVVNGYRRDSEVPFVRLNGNLLETQSYSYYLKTNDFVERRNPIKLIELTRISILDNFQYCCLRNLFKGIDELQIPAMEK